MYLGGLFLLTLGSRRQALRKMISLITIIISIVIMQGETAKNSRSTYIICVVLFFSLLKKD
jgi:hypothetical protein